MGAGAIRLLPFCGGVPRLYSGAQLRIKIVERMVNREDEIYWKKLYDEGESRWDACERKLSRNDFGGQP